MSDTPFSALAMVPLTGWLERATGPSALTMVTLAGSLARATGEAFVLVDAAGDAEHEVTADDIGRILPSIVDMDDRDRAAHETVAFSFATDKEAQEAFTHLTREAVAGYAATGGVALITYVGRVRGSPVLTTSNHSGTSRTLHVFEDGQLRDQPRSRA